MFLYRAKFEVTMKNRHRVLETGSILDLLYEATSMKKMMALWFSA